MVAADMLSKYGLQALLIGIYQQRRDNGESLAKLYNEIKKLPISRELKLVIGNAIGCQGSF